MIGRVALGLAALVVAACAQAADGRSIFAQHCAVCHLETAKGSPGFVPPLTDTLGYYTSVDGGRTYLAQIVTYGLAGPITVAGTAYNATMVLYTPLSDKEAADVLNYVLTQFDQKSLSSHFNPFTAQEISDARKEKLSAAQMHAKRQRLLDELSRSGKHR